MALGTFAQIVVNAADPPRLARFWAAVLGGDPVDRADGWSVLAAAADRPMMSFQPDPGAAAAPVRLHIDVLVADLAAATADAERLGARPEGPPVTDEYGAFQVLRDPEGNAFCLVVPR
ncbi:VOC family protein [Nocardiopsis trehalosi]|jgi:predicted enzyme related to lactoylglutathione lyase|uniref:VOC family protein n=1 Tax=Nocardiopsis trehalosi TaxID=109329 RepID=UPI0008333CE5|nr:VOC family protein [Nocardiopsis trehalosi]